MDVMIRNVDIHSDIRGIREAHGADEHWGSDRACFTSQKTRLENGFFIQVAAFGDKIAGHAEWVLSDEPEGRFLYLGMMQVREEYQKKGIGTKLIKAGEAYARENGCAYLRTMPNIESGSAEFYRKNGFMQTINRNSTLKIKTAPVSGENAVRIDKVPFGAVKTLPFVIGLYQHSSAHIWNVYNARSEDDNRTVSSFKIGKAYINIGAFEPSNHASVTCWGEKITSELITEILAAGCGLGCKFLNFCMLDENLPHFDAFNYSMLKEHDIFIQRYL